ncbi:hypothetical protein B0J18DRAFT_466739 [Chaetomium sp. MPI-SDFR-AT-0129]|nr:hypothetical protein B0J18DRAFT_466739 [Chaetomium sp. MPI-SDFR-AT-0129]
MDSVPEANMMADDPPSVAFSPPVVETKAEQQEAAPLIEAKSVANLNEPTSPTTSQTPRVTSPLPFDGNHQPSEETMPPITRTAHKRAHPEDHAEDTSEAISEDITEGIHDGAHEDNHEELSPPPDSYAGDTSSHASSVPPLLQDEIVVGSNVHIEPSPIRGGEVEDVVMGEQEDKTLIIQNAKRKRVSGIYAEDKEVSPAPTEEIEIRRPAGRPPKPQGTTGGGGKGVLLGYWRDSQAENDADKHSVVGFIDVRDRLRTRIQPITRDGRPMDPRCPIPPGPGGSWVTFDKVAFDPHLVGQNHHVVKEYVKIRIEDNRKDETSEERAKQDAEAVELASERVRTNPPPDAATAPLIAYGTEMPANALVPNRPENKKRRLAGSFGVPSESPKSSQASLDNIPGTRPTRILIGYWKQSSEEDPVNKHAVFGILGANDMFRVKLTRETRDGRTVIGNFPAGAGALWIHWDEVEFEPHLRKLSRNEIKEYCRVRQRQLDHGENPADRHANENQAVYEAQKRIAVSLATGIPIRRDDPDLLPLAMKGTGSVGPGSGHPSASFAPGRPSEEPRQSRRTENGRHPLPDVDFRSANRTPTGPGPNSAALERTNTLARREIARLEAAQARADMRAASRETSLGPVAAAAAAAAAGLTPTAHTVPSHGSQPIHGNTNTNGTGQGNEAHHFQNNVSRLNKVWEAQEANRLRTPGGGGDDAKIHMGVKYQRKQSGPFQGKLVSQGMIITIDGEDYVEYRVLTKPTFF